jgi:hypothetical protein
MAFLLADSFQASLEKLNGEEQKADKLAASKAICCKLGRRSY